MNHKLLDMLVHITGNEDDGYTAVLVDYPDITGFGGEPQYALTELKVSWYDYQEQRKKGDSLDVKVDNKAETVL